MNKIAIMIIAFVLVFGIGYKVRKSRMSGNGNRTAQIGQPGSASLETPANDSSGDSRSSGTHANNGVEDKSIESTSGVDGSSTGSNTTSNHGGTQTSGTSQDGKITTPDNSKPKEDCFAFEYRHKSAAKNKDIEEFLDFTNAFPIAHADYNPSTLCVKVNDKPENFTFAKTKNGPEVRVGSVVGPESVIRVSYCTGKVTCKESCVTAKKRFMDDMMSDAGDDDAFNDSWGKGDDAHKKDLKNKAKELRAVASESQSLNEGAVVRDWDTLQKQEWVCKESQKRKEK